MVGDGLGWMKVFGCRLEMGCERLYMGGSGLKLSRSGLNMSGDEQKRVEIERD